MILKHILILCILISLDIVALSAFGQDNFKASASQTIEPKSIESETKKIPDKVSLTTPIWTRTTTNPNAKQTTVQHTEEKQYNYFFKLVNTLNKYSSLLSATAAFVAAVIALYLGDWKSRFEKPKLKLTFKSENKYPFFQTLAFGTFNVPVDIHGQVADISRPGFNARVMIENIGKTTARNVEAKIEKIEFEDKTHTSTRYYHPTTVKWSGEKDWSPIDIVPNSYFFLDLFWAKNETTSEILAFNEEKFKNYGALIDRKILKKIIDDDIQPIQEIYWNVWVDNSYDRGLPVKYNVQTKIDIYFTVNSENCAPIRFKAIIKWLYETWDRPDIKVMSLKKGVKV